MGMNASSVDENNIIHCPSVNAWMATIEDSINAHRLVVTMFGASWSEQSKVIYNTMVQQKKMFPDVMFSKIDIDESKEIAVEMGVRIVPTVLFIQEGKEVGRIKLAVSFEVFRQKLMSYLQLQQS